MPWLLQSETPPTQSSLLFPFLSQGSDLHHDLKAFQFTHLKCTIRWFLEYSQVCSTITNFRIMSLHQEKKKAILFSSHSYNPASLRNGPAEVLLWEWQEPLLPQTWDHLFHCLLPQLNCEPHKNKHLIYISIITLIRISDGLFTCFPSLPRVVGTWSHSAL